MKRIFIFLICLASFHLLTSEGCNDKSASGTTTNSGGTTSHAHRVPFGDAWFWYGAIVLSVMGGTIIYLKTKKHEKS